LLSGYLVLGKNIFNGHIFTETLSEKRLKNKGVTVLGYRLKNPERFNVVEFDEQMNMCSIEENLCALNQNILRSD